MHNLPDSSSTEAKKSVFKRVMWTLVVFAIIGVIAAPKVLPLLGKAAPTKADAKGPGDRAKGPPPMRVSTIVLKPEPFTETVNSTGTLLAEEGVELQAETNGKIVAINFTEGALVHKGDLLVKLNDGELRASHARSTYRMQLAAVDEHRMALLLKEGVAKQVDYDAALSALQVQKAETELIEEQIAKTEIHAPFDGHVGLRYVSEGSYVNANARIATLQRLDKLKVDFAIPEKYAGRIKLGSPITFTVAGTERKYAGEIYAYDPRIDTATRTVLIRALCPNPDGALLPGAFANVELVLAKLDDALLVPAVAVIPGLNEKNVFVLNNGKAESRAVQTGTRTESAVRILSGLKPGDVVITSGLQQLRNGMPVQAAGSGGESNQEKGKRSRLAESEGAPGAPAEGAASDTAATRSEKPL